MTDPVSRTFAWTVPDTDAMAGIEMPFDPRAVFGSARAPVVVTINGHRYRSTIFTMHGRVWVPLRRSNRDAAGIGAGETVAVTMTLDTAPRVADLPADVDQAIDAQGLRTAWDARAYTWQRERAEAIEGAKQPETRSRRVAALLAALAGD